MILSLILNREALSKAFLDGVERQESFLVSRSTDRL